MKICRECKEEKELTEFYKQKNCKNGLNPKCKLCVRRIKKDKYTPSKKREYYENNKIKIKENMKEYNKKNKEVLRDKKLEYYQENRELILDRNREWRRNNRDKVNAKEGRRNANKLNQTPNDQTTLEKSMIRALYWISKVLSNSCEEQFHVDHIHPLSRGGIHEFNNLQVLSAEENLKKSNKVTRSE